MRKKMSNEGFELQLLTGREAVEFERDYIPLRDVVRSAEVQEAMKPALERLANPATMFEGREALTSGDFYATLAVMQHVLENPFKYAFEDPDTDISKLFAEVISNDFTAARIYSSTEVENLLEVEEGEDYKSTYFDDSYTDLAVKKWGRIIPMTWEAIQNDRLGIFKDLQAKLIRAYKRTFYKEMNDVFVGNLTFFNAGNSNYMANGELNQTYLEEACTMVRDMKDSKSNKLFLRPKYLVVPSALEFTAEKLVNPMLASIAAPNMAAGVTQFKLEKIVDPELDDTSTTGWYLFADPKDVPALKRVALRNHPGVELLMKKSDQEAIAGAIAGGDLGSFKNDTIELKVRTFFNTATAYSQGAVYSTGVPEEELGA